MAVVTTYELYITTTGDGNSHLVHKETCEIVCDSILKNKEKTKSYWEKLMLAAKLASCNLQKVGMNDGKTKEESLIEREIRMQQEREEAVANERQAALKLLAKYPEEPLNSIPTTDEGNFSECGSEEKEQSLDSCGDAEEEKFSHERSPSYESMSSGHSSGSDSSPRQKSIVKPLDETSEPQSILKNHKETPIEKEIRLAKEREDELKREKMIFSNGKPPKGVSKNDNIKAELESISLKKCVSMSSLPMALQNETSNAVNGNNVKTSSANTKSSRLQSSRQSFGSVATPKLFTPHKGQKGVMKRFLESHGKILPTFTVVSNSSNSAAKPSPESTADRSQLNFQKPKTQINYYSISAPSTRRASDFFASGRKAEKFMSRRPGYRSAEDKIHMELKEMKRREAELKQERARLMGRSQPNLQDIGNDDKPYLDLENDEDCKLPPMGKLRSALSNPTLFINKPFVQKTPAKRRSALIDAWENRLKIDN